MSQSWERIQSLFLEALDLRPEERASFLDAACADDAEVRREVESLIAHDGTDEQPIADALEDTAQSLFESENLDRTRLGAWRVLRKSAAEAWRPSISLGETTSSKSMSLKVVNQGCWWLLVRAGLNSSPIR